MAEQHKILAIQPLHSYLITYTDDDGRPHKTICSEVDGALYIHPDSEVWVARNKSLPEQVQRQFQELRAKKEASK